jgi:hypothetical protein
MQFEQPAELNRYVDSTIPLTWSFRWKQYKLFLPVMVFCSAVMVDQLVFRLWLNDRSLISELPLICLAALFPAALFPLMIELQHTIMRRCKRTIKLEPKAVVIIPGPGKWGIAWKRVKWWRLEPVVNAPELAKLTLEYWRYKTGKQLREWSIALRQSDQVPGFLSELDSLRRTAGKAGEVAQLMEPSTPKTSNRPTRGGMRMMFGLFLFLHGFPLLFAGIFFWHRQTNEGKPRFSPTELAKIQRVVAAHFTSAGQLRHFFLIVGGSLTLLAAGFYFWGLSAMKRSRNIE